MSQNSKAQQFKNKKLETKQNLQLCEHFPIKVAWFSNLLQY